MPCDDQNSPGAKQKPSSSLNGDGVAVNLRLRPIPPMALFTSPNKMPHSRTLLLPSTETSDAADFLSFFSDEPDGGVTTPSGTPLSRFRLSLSTSIPLHGENRGKQHHPERT